MAFKFVIFIPFISQPSSHKVIFGKKTSTLSLRAISLFSKYLLSIESY